MLRAPFQIRLLISAAVAMITLACASSHPAGLPAMAIESGDAAAIRAGRLEQNRAMAAGEVDQAEAFWTEDVTIRRGLGTPVTGRPAYRKLLEADAGNAQRVVYQRIPSGIEVSARWPLAFETGVWRGRLGNATGPEVISGRYSAQWVRRDGRWLIRSEVFVALRCQASGCDFAAVP